MVSGLIKYANVCRLIKYANVSIVTRSLINVFKFSKFAFVDGLVANDISTSFESDDDVDRGWC